MPSRLLRVLAALGLLLAANVAGSGRAVAAPSGTGGTTVLHIEVSAAGTTGLPSRLPAGEYTFLVHQPGVRNLQLGRFRGDYTAAQLDADISQGFAGGDMAALGRIYADVVFEGGTGSAPNTFTTYLEPGRYFYLDSSGPTPVVEFAVTAAGRTAPDPPRAGVTVTGLELARDPGRFAFDIAGTFARSGVLRFAVTGPDEPHFVSINKLRPGATAQECMDDAGPPGPQAPCREVFTTGLVSPRQSMYMPYSLAGAGRYLLVCFLPDPASGESHAALGMTRLVTVT